VRVGRGEGRGERGEGRGERGEGLLTFSFDSLIYQEGVQLPLITQKLMSDLGSGFRISG
jgi:hypothetical protein